MSLGGEAEVLRVSVEWAALLAVERQSLLIMAVEDSLGDIAVWAAEDQLERVAPVRDCHDHFDRCAGDHARELVALRDGIEQTLGWHGYFLSVNPRAVR